LKMLQHLRNLWTRGATFTDTRRGGSRGSRGARERGSGSCENAADQGAQGARRSGPGAGTGERAGAGGGRGLGQSWRSGSQRYPQNPQMMKWKRGSEH